MIKFDNGNYFDYDMIGEFHSVDEWIHPKRIISSYELIFVLDGTVYITEDGNEYEIGKNEMIILEPDKEHYGTKTVNGQTIFYWFHFYTDLDFPFKTAKNSQEFDIKYLLKKLLHITNTSGFSKASADSLGYLIFEELTQLSRKNTEKVSSIAILIKEYIRNNVNQNITVSEISNHLGYNTDYIGKVFKNLEGITLKNYIADQRLKFSKDLLITTNLSVKEIASRLGYSDENLFIKFFLYHDNISPTLFRKMHYNTHINNK